MVLYMQGAYRTKLASIQGHYSSSLPPVTSASAATAALSLTSMVSSQQLQRRLRRIAAARPGIRRARPEAPARASGRRAVETQVARWQA